MNFSDWWLILSPFKLPSDECHRTLLMISQHWFHTLRLETPWRHPMSQSRRWAMICILWIFWRICLHYNDTKKLTSNLGMPLDIPLWNIITVMPHVSTRLLTGNCTDIASWSMKIYGVRDINGKEATKQPVDMMGHHSGGVSGKQGWDSSELKEIKIRIW